MSDAALNRREDRIRAHVILCWLALLLMRVAENTAERPWARIRDELQRQHTVTWTGSASTFPQTTDLTKPLRHIYTALRIEPPKKILGLNTRNQVTQSASQHAIVLNSHRTPKPYPIGHFG